MKIIIVDKIARIIKSRLKLERFLNVRITNRGREVKIEGSAEDEYAAEKIIDALNFGFPLGVALLIKEEDNVFEVVRIKDHTTRHDLERVRGRIIGKGGGTLKTLNELTKCYFELKDNEVGILGHPEYIENAQEALISLIKGSKQSNVYAHLEKNQVKLVEDLGLREDKK
jgi:ribosomal RNA assembly protein